MALRGTISGNQIGFAPAGSLRLGAVPQATSLPEGGIYANLFHNNDTKK